VAQREMTQLLDRDVLPAAEAAVTLMTEGWRAGKFDLFRLLQTSRGRERRAAPVPGDAGPAVGFGDCSRSRGGCAMKMSRRSGRRRRPGGCAHRRRA
jgi:hypothetical protein